ncbi:DUF2207 domain-containing protein [Siminovitchia sp. 179-K 8D1 HS]|uniref:DUF2207 domain-containing protein n=1 Tax=Siminovitchia sp. 179-K 8D1 HS TaxID=3142385 RepID=UPI0039A15580
MKKKLIFFLVLFFLMILPVQALAVEFSITDVNIDAYLHKNGDVQVTEVHSYSFDDKFRGITREIIPKKGTEITHFTANEGEKELKVKKEKDLYKVYRSGNHEDITLELHYVIKNSLSRHPDLTVFYWPFFDERNEADYERMTITIHPPADTDDVIAFGYDEAFGKETVEQDGAVTFHLNKVDAGQNGDIRVAYDSTLFPGVAESSDQKIRQTLLDEEQLFINKAQTFAENRKKTALVGKWLLFVSAALLIGLMASETVRRKQRKRAAKEEVYNRENMIPKQKLSMPAVLYFLHHFTPELLAAALMDLVRKGYVRQVSEDQFMLLDRETEEIHEKLLLELLFEKVGGGKTFSLDDLKQYVQSEINRATYQEETRKWQDTVKKEIDRFNLYENNMPLRRTLGIAGMAVLTSSIFFIMYDLYWLMFLSMALGITSLCLAIFYRPFSYEGLLLKEEWARLENEFEQISISEWDRSGDDEKWRLLIYGVGTKKTRLADYFAQMMPKTVPAADNHSAAGFFYTGPFIASSFETADEHVRQSTTSDSSGTSSFSGGGVGGGGGGSGAF